MEKSASARLVRTWRRGARAAECAVPISGTIVPILGTYHKLDGEPAARRRRLFQRSAASSHLRMYGSRHRLSFARKERNHSVSPSHLLSCSSRRSTHPSSSSVQFALALLRSMDVVTQLNSSSSPPRATG